MKQRKHQSKEKTHVPARPPAPQPRAWSRVLPQGLSRIMPGGRSGNGIVKNR